MTSHEAGESHQEAFKCLHLVLWATADPHGMKWDRDVISGDKVGKGLKKSNTRNRNELGEDCPNQSGGLTSGAGRSDGSMKERKPR